MVRRTRNEIRLAELRNVELGPLHRPVSGSHRGLQDKEIAVGSSAFQSSGGGSCSRRVFRLWNCSFLQFPLPRVAGVWLYNTVAADVPVMDSTSPRLIPSSQIETTLIHRAFSRHFTQLN